jgi:RHS repeat-associated protein
VRISPRPVIAVVLAGALLGASRSGAEDACDVDTGAVSGSVQVGDKSTPPCGFVDLWAVPETGDWKPLGPFEWGEGTVRVPPGTWRFAAHACDTYLPFHRSAPVKCARNAKGCVRCDGSFKLRMYGLYGGFSGQVTLLPEDVPAGPGVPVNAVSGMTCGTEKFGYTDKAGRFVIAATIEPHRSNHWGVMVDGDGTGPGSRRYLLNADSCENGVAATTRSSTDVVVDIYRLAPYMTLQNPSARPFPHPPLLPVAPPHEVGRGIGLTTGNLSFDQVDLEVQGAPGSLRFVRSYNSQSAAQRGMSGLGPGWTHSYDPQLSFPASRVAMLVEDEGRALYFVETETAGTYKASVPAGERSVVVRTDRGYERRFPGGGRDAFAGSGRLVSRRSAAGRTTELERDAQGRLTAVVDPDGRRLTLIYGGAGELQKLAMGTTVLATFAHGAQGRVRAVTYADGTGFVFGYDALGQMRSLADLEGRLLRSYLYEGNKAVSYEIAEGQEKVTLQYGPLRTKVTDALGRVTTYEWLNVRGLRVITSVLGPCPECRAPDPAVIPGIAPPWPLAEWAAPAAAPLLPTPEASASGHEWTYDALGRVVSHRARSGVTSTLTYDEGGRVTAASDSTGRVVRLSYDDAGRIVALRAPSVVDPKLERSTQFAFDDKGRLSSRFESGLGGAGRPVRLGAQLAYDGAGRLARVESAGVVRVFAYDKLGHLVSESLPHGLGSTFADHTLLGRPKMVTDANGVATLYTYDAAGRVLTRSRGADATAFEYAPGGQLKRERRPRGNGLEHVYDAYGRLTETHAGDGQRTVRTYDKAGQLVREEVRGTGGAVERERTYQYDGLGRMTRAAVPEGDQYEWTYDDAGRIVSRRGPGAETAAVRYDEAGNVGGLRYQGGGSWTYRYDTRDALLSAVDAQGGVHSYSHDDFGRLLYASTPAAATSAFVYDGGRQLISRTDGRGVTALFDRDSLGRLLAVRYPTDAGVAYTWDTCANGRGRVCVASDGVGRVSFAYDVHGRVVQELRESKNVRFDTRYAYDRNGNLAEIRYPTGRSVSYAWDEGDALKSVSTGAPGTGRVLVNLTHAADGLVTGLAYADGNATKIVRDRQGRVRAIRAPREITYTYDGQGNVASIARDGKTQTYEYGPGRRLSQAIGPWGTVQWGYDPNGNRMSETGSSGAVSLLYHPRTPRLASVTGGRPVEVLHDAAGLVVRIGPLRFAYDEAARLVAVASGETRQATYAYDYKGRRISKTTKESTVFYHYDTSDRLLAETRADGTVLTEYVYASGLPVAVARGALYFLHLDHRGAPIVATDAEGRVAWERVPSPFGDDAPAATGMRVPLRGPGEYYDDETGYVHNGARDYEPRLGRYFQADPCFVPGTLPADGVYAVAAQNPLGFVAPEGRQPRPVVPEWAVRAPALPIPRVVPPGCDEPTSR